MAKATTKVKDETKQVKSGKGLTRVQIAQAAWERAQGLADAAKARLDEAIAAEAANSGKAREKKRAAAERAAKALEKAGLNDLAAKARKEAGLV